MIRVLVCGGRDYQKFLVVEEVLSDIHKRYGISLLIQGGAKGADALAGEWAKTNAVTFVTQHANWAKYGKAAGMIRNKEMLQWEPNIVIAFPGGVGTAGMVKLAKDAGISVTYVNGGINE